MKRLVDSSDPDDEVVRLLVRAGAAHQPPALGKLRLIAALGVGSAVGLSASKVLAWLGTNTGKAALAVTVVGAAAGGAYVVTGSASTPHASTPHASAPKAAAPIATPAVPTPVAALPSAPPPSPPAPTPAGVRPPAAPDPTAAPSLVRRAAPRVTPSRAHSPQPEPAPAAIDLVASDEAARAASLTAETRWVDRLRVAADGDDRATFETLLAEYNERFPQGQLHPEVDRLRTSLR